MGKRYQRQCPQMRLFRFPQRQEPRKSEDAEGTAQVHGEDRRQAESTVQTEQLVRDAKGNNKIKNAWIRIIQAEDHLTRDSAAFIPKVWLQETNPTFKHPENWDSLSLQDKAKLIIAD